MCVMTGRSACSLTLLNFTHRIEQQINKQTEYAVEKADVVFFLIDGKVGVTTQDQAIAASSLPFPLISSWLRSKRDLRHLPIITVVNKVRLTSLHHA